MLLKTPHGDLTPMLIVVEIKARLHAFTAVALAVHIPNFILTLDTKYMHTARYAGVPDANPLRLHLPGFLPYSSTPLLPVSRIVSKDYSNRPFCSGAPISL